MPAKRWILLMSAYGFVRVFAINFLRLITPSTQKSYLFRPLYTSLFMVVLLILVQHGLNLWLGYFKHEASENLTHAVLLEQEEDHLLNAVIDLEKRLVEGDELETISFENNFNRLYHLLKDNPSQLRQLDHIKDVYQQLQSELSQQNFSNVQSRDSRVEMTLFGALRNKVQGLVEQEQNLLSDRTMWLTDLHQINIVLNIISTVLILLAVGFHLQLLHRRATVTLHQLKKKHRKSATDYRNPDKISQLTEVVDAMVNEIQRRQICIQVRNQNLEELICTLSHDLRTPLLATRTTLESMLKGAFGAVSDTWREVFKEYHQTNEDLIRLVEALLDISRYEAGNQVSLNYEPLNWEKIVVKVIDQIQAISESDFCINYRIAHYLPTIYGDELEIRRVLQNLLDNAVRVSELHKQISIEVASFKHNQVKVSVRDQGRGIAPQEKEQLFYRFVQGRGRRGKCGLGLYLCRQIIEAHGGIIGVDSSLGKGSTFWFTLPANTDKARFHHA